LSAAHLAGVRVGLGTDIGGGTTLSMLRTMAESYKVCQLAGQQLSPRQAFYLATLGGAASLYLDGQIGNFDVGKEADFVVLDPAGIPHLARRVDRATTLDERLFALMILGDDRAVHATHILGTRAHVRECA
jgi:guanine deaminase